MDMFMKLYRFFEKYISTVVIAFLAYFFSNTKFIKFNGIPEDQLFNFNIIFYSALFLLILTLFGEALEWIENRISVVEITFSSNKEKFSSQDLDLNFRNDVLEVYIRVKLRGDPKKLGEQIVNLIFPVQVQVQLLNESKKYCNISDNGDIKIMLQNIFNTNKREKIAGDSATFVLLVTKVDEKVGGHIETSFEAKNRLVKLKKNDVYLDQ